MSYVVNYGSKKDPDIVEMVQVAEHEAVRRDFAEAQGLVRQTVPKVPAKRHSGKSKHHEAPHA